MILAALLAGLGLWLALALPAPACAVALLLVPPCVWLITGGGDRWLARREASRR